MKDILMHGSYWVGEDFILEVLITPTQAQHLAQFIKRVGFSDFRGNAQDDAEAYAMRDALDLVGVALRDAGFAPR
jgi:dissimilatory sulfite reductase (desulfoviridin) alpha/beta subunit